MQVFCHQLLTAWGVLPRHIVGYGFASPTVLAGHATRPPAQYPLYHILNSDDLVPRIGALMHLGLCLLYPADSALRDAAYGWGNSPAEAEARAQAEALFSHITDTPTMLECLAALCATVAEEKTEESLLAFAERWWSVAPLEKVFQFAGGKATASLTRMARYARVAYRSVTGRRMDEATVERLIETMRPTVRDVPARRLFASLRDRFYPPHMLCRAHYATGAYGYITQQGGDKLRAAAWDALPDEEPQLCFVPSGAAFAPASAPGRVSVRHGLPVRGPARRNPRNLGLHGQRVRRGTTAPRVARPRRNAPKAAPWRLPLRLGRAFGHLQPRRKPRAR